MTIVESDYYILLLSGSEVSVSALKIVCQLKHVKFRFVSDVCVVVKFMTNATIWRCCVFV